MNSKNARMAAPPAVLRDPSPSRRGRGNERLAFWLLLPSVAMLALVIAYPMAKAVYRSFFDDRLSGPAAFAGLGNYTKALWGTGGTDFWAAFRVTFLFTGVSVVLEVVLGMAMAAIMHRAFRGRGLVRASVLVPWAIPTAVAAVLWRWALDPRGIVNHLLGSDITWTGSEWPSKLAIITADTWKTTPFMALLILAGLQLIPEEVYEAARLDGANAFQRFRYITLPLVKPALIVAILFRMLDALRMYDLPAILTNGANDTTTLSILVVRASLGDLKPGYGGALSTLTFLIIFVTAFLFVRVLGTGVAGRERS